MNKKLGQHFLINKSAVKKIISALDLKPNDTVIEIGPGKGVLTFPLMEKCRKIGCKIIAIEKDKKLFQKLVNSNWQLEIIEGDALKIIPTLITNYKLPITDYKIVGNIPYYITGKLLRLLGELITNYQLPITNIVLMIQKEVAERICGMRIARLRPSASGNTNGHIRMNLLAAAVQFWAEPKILFTLKPDDFQPPPKVESAVIKLTTDDKRLTTKFSENYYKLIKILFKQPRKTVFNNLKSGLKIEPNELKKWLSSHRINPELRPQNLDLKTLIKLAADFPSLSTNGYFYWQ